MEEVVDISQVHFDMVSEHAVIKYILVVFFFTATAGTVQWSGF